jgi:diaminohydroxyphosphoribosylaminopyrimidine deaminase/5-amino-6-(5-phosphoribosylamino)uracil reductase
MREALELAGEGTALASPGPRVGAVIVTAKGEAAGKGFYRYDSVAHAEVIALQQAGEAARGSTLYVTLEPHCYLSRTPPCTEAIGAAGVKRVVAAMADPNPKVSGRGFEQLRAAGITVDVGLLGDEAHKLNESFAAYILGRRPLVTLKSGMTLDGKIAPPPGEPSCPSALGAAGAGPGWITSAEARAHVQELRHESDAILVGVGTVIADDPLLTDRTGRPRRRPLLRVILDSRLRLSLDSRLVKTACNDVLVFCSFAEEHKKAELERCGVRVEQVPLGSNDGWPDLPRIITRLGQLEITSLMIEGGALVNWAALAAGIVHKVFFYYAPKILAGAGAVPFATGPGWRLTEAPAIRNITLHRFGEDFAVEGYLRDPYAAAHAGAGEES